MARRSNNIAVEADKLEKQILEEGQEMLDDREISLSTIVNWLQFKSKKLEKLRKAA